MCVCGSVSMGLCVSVCVGLWSGEESCVDDPCHH